MLKKSTKIKTPSMLQIESAECGVVALAIILGFYKKWLSVESLRADCGANRDGSNAANLLKAGRKHGLVSKGYQSDNLDFDAFGYPSILHWNFNHFVVLEGRINNGFSINDPAQGRRNVSKEEMSNSFTGVILGFEPSEGFVPTGEKPSWISSLYGYLRNTKDSLLLIFMIGIALIIPGALIPMISKIFVDEILINAFSDWLKPLLIGMLATGMLLALLSYFQSQLMLILQAKLAITMGSKFVQRAFELPLKFFAQRSAGEMATRPMLIDRLSQLMAGPLGMAMVGWITALAYVVIMLFYDVPLTVTIVGLALLNILVFIWQAKKLESLNQVIIREQSQYEGATLRTLQLLPEIKASGAENVLFSQLVGQKAKWSNQQNNLVKRQSMLEALPSMLQLISTGLLLLVGGSRVIEGHITMGVFVAMQGLMVQFMFPLRQMLSLFGELQETRGNLERVEDITMHQESAPVSWDDYSRVPKRVYPKVSIRNLVFGYQPFNPPLLEDFNLEITPGKWVALVGKSGSGKSSLINLLTGLQEPWEGDVEIGGRNIKDIPSVDLRASFSLVDQNIVLFNASVKENISLWNSALDDEQIYSAAKIAGIHEWIIHQQGGYSYKISENGKNISGGEKARLEIARALATNPDFIILDEATAALDPVLEKKVLGAIQKKCHAGILVSHRISAVKHCDEIIVFDEGVVVQRGSHNELVSDSAGLYHALFAEEG